MKKIFFFFVALSVGLNASNNVYTNVTSNAFKSDVEIETFEICDNNRTYKVFVQTKEKNSTTARVINVIEEQDKPCSKINEKK